MRRLMLLRHAKSAWPEGMADDERPLAPRGREAAPRMGLYLAQSSLLPDLVLVSPARRARETWEIVAPLLPPAETREEPRIYEAPAASLLAVVREAPDSASTLLLVGHNPGFETLARALTGHGDRDAFARLRQKFPTAGLAVIDFEAASWRDLAPASGRLDRFVTPRTLGADADDD